jgi:predicted transcriptional regulator
MRGLAAKQVMTSKVLAAEADWSIERLSEFLIVNSISGSPVQSKKGHLIGVVSLTDIVHYETQHEKDPQWPHDYYLHALERQCSREEAASFRIEAEPLKTVRAIMTPMIFQVTEHTPVQEVADMMIKNRIHRVFVTRNEKVIGIISTPDMLKVIRDM